MANDNLQTSNCPVNELRKDLFAGLSGRMALPLDRQVPDAPLIVAIHGGSYTSAYFDLPGHSLLQRGSSLGIPVLALDRPSYGESICLPAEERTLRGQARFLVRALEEAWSRYGGSTSGIVLVGHSVGGAIATIIASETQNLPLIGLAISGFGFQAPKHLRSVWEGLPDTPLVHIPTGMKDIVIFGPAGSYDSHMPAASHVADALAPRQEVIDIVTTWPETARATLSAVRVPVHYRQGEFDQLWIVDEEEVKQFGRGFLNSPRVDAQMVQGAGHGIDFHRIGAAIQVQQLGFALQCAVEAPAFQR